MKILFLDIDGVLNCKTTTERQNGKGGMIGIDPHRVLLLHRILEQTGAEVVLSSSWRSSKDGIDQVSATLVPFALIGKTPRLSGELRGTEVRAYLETRFDVERYAIIDDDSDFLWGQPLFKTSWEVGLTDEIAQKVIDHLNQ